MGNPMRFPQDPQLTPRETALMECIVAIVVSLKESFDYKNAHYTGFRNPENGGLVILAQSPDEKYHFAIEVRTWDPSIPDPAPIMTQIYHDLQKETNVPAK